MRNLLVITLNFKLYVIYLVTDFVGVRRSQIWKILGGNVVPCLHFRAGVGLALLRGPPFGDWETRRCETWCEQIWVTGGDRPQLGVLAAVPWAFSIPSRFPFHKGWSHSFSSSPKCPLAHVTFSDNPYLTSPFSPISSLVSLEHVHFSLICDINLSSLHNCSFRCMSFTIS